MEQIKTYVCRSNNCTRSHRMFSIDRGDRAFKDWREAINCAISRVESRQKKQRVLFHRGVVFKQGVWYVQDIDS